MPRALRFILSTILPLVLLSFVTLSSFAQTPAQSFGDECPPNQNADAPTYSINDYPVGDCPNLWTDPQYDGTTINGKPGLRIDGTVRKVNIKFTGLDDGDYYLCAQSNYAECKLNPNLLKKFTASNGTISVDVCGAGKETLKGKSTTNSDNINSTNGCNDQKDYFHEGHDYALTVFQDKAGGTPIVSADFFVRHSYPLIKMAPSNGTTFKSTSPIDVSLWGRRPGVDSDNNYQLILEGTTNNFKREVCFDAKEGSGDTVGVDTQGVDSTNQKVIPDHILNGTGWDTPARSASTADTRAFSPSNNKTGGIGQGSFVLKVNERISETSRAVRNAVGLGGTCEGGFTYMYVYFTFDSQAPNGIRITGVVYDPNNSDRNDLDDQANPDAGQPPCAPGALDKTNKNCSAVNTAIGNIETTPQGFINSMFRFVLMLAGFGGIIILIYSGYLLMRSQGDKEKVAAARETITSAILGILFIVLSIVILEIIGVDILRIPGFTR
ncbi:MAG TPA: hypothetical protein VHE53_03215 [Patescibacteria group bacterium]|nr:hypothetical protein [Patescibacteria group bacterium]